MEAQPLQRPGRLQDRRPRPAGGGAWVPLVGLDAEEWVLYVRTVARACDRGEYLAEWPQRISDDMAKRDRAMGLDGYKGWWLAVTLVRGRFHAAEVYDTITEALAADPEAAVVGVDVPIGFGDGQGRKADEEAKEFVGARANSVFPTFPEAVYETPSHFEAAELARRLSGKAISQQSYALRAKIREAASAAAVDSRLVEVHPEVSFRELAGACLGFSKRSWNGAMERRRLLEEAGIVLPHVLPGDAGRASVDDVLDAAVVAWTARRVAEGKAKVLPAHAPPRRGQTGLIWP
jgi:predicted RNase H-like nuclease